MNHFAYSQVGTARLSAAGTTDITPKLKNVFVLMQHKRTEQA
jgi:hypothetical protein